MSLQVWLPLNGNLANNGIYPASISVLNSTGYTAGKLGDALYLTTDSHGASLNNYMSVCSTYSTYTMAAWVYMTETATNHSSSILSTGNWNAGASQLCFGFYNYSGGYKKLLVPNRSSWEDGINLSSAVQLNTWYHVCITYDGAVTKGYINGQYIGQYSGGGITPSSESNNLYIGAATYYSGFTLRGKLNDLRIYNSCLSAQDVKDISKGLVMNYPLNNGYVEPTTNIVESNKATFTGGWVSYSNGYTSMTPTDMGPGSLVITNKLSWCGAYTWFTIPEAGTYTISVYCKPISRTSSDISQTLYFSAGEYSDNAVAVSWIPGKWQRISMTRTFSGYCGGTLYLIAYGGDGTGTISCEYTMPQIEKNDHPTPFCVGSRTGLSVSDTAGYKNHGTSSVSPTCLAGSVRYDKCYNFDGGNQSIQIPFYNAVVNSGIFTVNFWFYKSEWGSKGYETLLGGPSGFELESKSSSTNEPYLVAYNWGGGRAAYTLNAWHMVTMVRTTSDTKFYLDGTLVINGSAGSIPSGNYFIGAWNTSSQQNFKGKMSDFRVYTTALTQADITDLYNAPIKIARSGTLVTNGEVIE